MEIVIKKRIPIPRICGDYINIYSPSSDIYLGENTKSFCYGKTYDKWITNDFSIIRMGEKWHIVGITHPCPEGFVDGFVYPEDVHEAEYQLFHCTAEGKSFGDVFREKAFKDCKKILYPNERPGEPCEIWAPHIMERDGKISVIYSPGAIREIRSLDFTSWGHEKADSGKKSRMLFECKTPAARDPFVYVENGIYTIFYVEDNRIEMRTSSDFENWSEPEILQTNPYRGGCCESPFVTKRGDYYYLLWCLYDDRNGSYDNRTFVFAGETLSELKDTAPVAILNGHAPEFVTDPDGQSYILSVFHPENGINAAKLMFE